MRTALGLAMVTLTMVFASVADARQYTVTVCAPRSSDWAAANTAPTVLSTTVNCPSPLGQSFGGYLVAARVGTPNTASGDWAAWSLSAPPSMLIDRLALERYLGTTSQGWVTKIVTAENRELERCERPWWATGCELGAAGGSGRLNEVVFPALATASVSFVVECASAGPACANGDSAHTAWVAVYRATVMIDDPAPPTVSALSGTITAPGWHKGTDTASFSASDGSGVKRLRLMAGTTELGRQEQSCDYSRMQPCPGQATASFDLNTARVGDGTYELRAVAEDASEQEGATVGTLRVDRTPPKPPTDLTTERAEDGTYTLAWTNPDQGTAAPITAAHFALCDPLGKSCEPPTVSTGTGITRIAGVTFSGPEAPRTLRVWLEDQAGNVDPTYSTALPVDTSARAAPRVIQTGPPVLSPGPKPSPRLRITRARRSESTLTISGTIARAASARIEALLSRSSTGRPVVAKARVKPKRGKWTARVNLPASLRDSRAMYLAVKYAGQSGYRATTLRRRLTERAPRAGRVSDEFSLGARSR